jgi:hypothetical protein
MVGWNRWLRRQLVVAGIVFVCLICSRSSRAQQLAKPGPPEAIESQSLPTADLTGMSSRQRNELMKRFVKAVMPELEFVANEGAVANDGKGRIQLLRVGECLARVSTQGGFKRKPSDEQGLVGICIVHGDLNVPCSETVFAISIGAWRVSRQEHPLKGTEATLESIVVIDAEEP